jgi:hypothetical protein
VVRYSHEAEDVPRPTNQNRITTMKRIKSTMTGWTKNGRRSYIHESKVEIKKVNGFWEIFGGAEDGYRYEIEIEKPLYSFTTKVNFYPPVFLVEIINE